jgi:carbamoyl-phosphate synthase/aspartate carbamoyltransferase
MPEEVKKMVLSVGCASLTEHAELDSELLGRADVVYVTRVQRERFADPLEYEALKLRFVVTPETLAQCKPTCVLMHPLPRCGEIDPACDSDSRAAYFRQMENGLWVF